MWAGNHSDKRRLSLCALLKDFHNAMAGRKIPWEPYFCTVRAPAEISAAQEQAHQNRKQEALGDDTASEKAPLQFQNKEGESTEERSKRLRDHVYKMCFPVQLVGSLKEYASTVTGWNERCKNYITITKSPRAAQQLYREHAAKLLLFVLTKKFHGLEGLMTGYHSML